MKRLAFLFSAFLALVAPGVARAQQPLSDFLAGSDGASVALRASEASAHVAHSQIELARARLLPNFNATGILQYNEVLVSFANPFVPGTQLNIQLHDQITGQLTLTVPLLDVAGWTSFFASEQAADAADERFDGARQDVHVAVVQLWHQLVAAHAVRDAAQHNLEVVQASRDNVQARFDAQVAPQLELSRAEAEVLRAEQTIAEADLNITLAERNLELTTGIRPTSDPRTLEDDLHEEPAIDQFMTRAHDAPAVRAAARSVRAAELSTDAAWEGFLPTIAGAFRESATNAAGFGATSQYALLLTASWTLDWGRGAQVMVASDQLAGAHAAEDLAVQQAESAVFEQWHRVRSLRIRAEAAIGARDALARASQDAHARYEAGAATQLEVITADRDLLQAEVARIAAVADLRIARQTLRIRAGMDVE